MAGNGSISIDGYPGILHSRKIFIHINTAISSVKTFQLGPHPPRRKFLALLVACIILVPSLLVLTPSARGSVTTYSFRDDFNYSGIDAMISAGWTKCGNAPPGFYSVANGILTLKNNGTMGASMCWNKIPTDISDWTTTLRGEWTGKDIDYSMCDGTSTCYGSPYYGTLEMVVQTKDHSYEWGGDGTSAQFFISRDGVKVFSAFGYGSGDTWTSLTLRHVWRDLGLQMASGVLTMYFDGQRVGAYTEPDLGTSMVSIMLLAGWVSTENWDYVTVNSAPASIPTISLHAPIVITGNSGFTAANGVNGGSGTATDPYVIGGWDINMMNYPSNVNESEIEITNANAYFIIRNVQLNGTNNGITLENVTNGAVEYSTMESFSGNRILVVSSQNILLDGNNIPGGVCGYSEFAPDNCDQQDSLKISSSSGITISKNNVGFETSGYAWASDYRVQSGVNIVDSSSIEIIANTFSARNLALELNNSTSTTISGNGIDPGWPGGVGIELNNSTQVAVEGNDITDLNVGIELRGSMESHLYYNNFIHNTTPALDDSTSNSWDAGYPTGGNYWSDYKGGDNCSGPQQNICPGPDGIGDTPYVFTSSQDNYPLMNPFVDPPAVSFSVHVQASFSASLGTISRTVSVTATNITSGEVIFVATRTITYQ